MQPSQDMELIGLCDRIVSIAAKIEGVEGELLRAATRAEDDAGYAALEALALDSEETMRAIRAIKPVTAAGVQAMAHAAYALADKDEEDECMFALPDVAWLAMAVIEEVASGRLAPPWV